MKNSKVILIVVTVVIVLFGVVFLVLAGGEDPLADNSTSTSSGQTSESSSQAETPVESEAPIEDVNPLGYQDYDYASVAQTENKKVLFFHAAWCPTCKALDQNIRAGTVPANLTIFKVNYDTESDLKKEHGVTYQHTLVQVDDNGEQLHKWAGSYTIDQIVDEMI